MSYRILLVEDESALLALLKRFLERNGHTVQACLCAEDAQSFVAPNAASFPDILIVDHTLPGISGSELAVAALKACPTLRCLLCSGYPLDLTAIPPTLRPRVTILQKPYLPAELESAIGRL